MRYRRIPIALALILALAGGLAGTAAVAAAPGVPALQVNGQPVKADVPPFIDTVSGRIMVPVRAVSEILGARVAWFEDTRKVYVGLGDVDVWLSIGSRTATLNGGPVTLDVAPVIRNSRAFVPIRFIAESLGAKVSWNGATSTASFEKRDYKVTAIEWIRQDGVGKVFVFSQGLIGVPVARAVTAPDKIIIDIPDVIIPVSWPDKVIGDGVVNRIRAGMLQSDPNIARVVIELAEPVRYRAYRNDTVVEVEIGYKVAGLAVAVEDTETVVRVATTGPLTFKTGTLTGPDRLLVDVYGATLGQAVTAPFAVPVSGGDLVSQVRMAQFSVDPDIVRVVLDLKKPVVFGVGAGGQGLVIRVAPPQPAINYARAGLSGRLTLDAAVPLGVTEKHELPRKLVFDVAGLPSGPAPVTRPVFDGTVDRVHLAPLTGGGTRVTLELPYYLGHKVTPSADRKSVTIEVAGSPLYGKIVIIDPGHGGGDPGTVGYSNTTVEKTVNLDIAQRLRALLEKAGARAFLTRESDGESPTLQRRVEFANSRDGDMVISIHNNSFNIRDAGTETYYFTNHPASKTLATLVQAAVVAELGRADRGLKSAAFTVLTDTVMPAALVEGLFMSNPTEEAMLKTPEVRQRIALALYNALLSFAGR